MQAPALPSFVPHDIPESFFKGLPDPTLPKQRATTVVPQPTAAIRAMVLYDIIIDDMLTNPGTTLQDTARRLNKAASTIGLIVKSDFFRARWHQRREKYNEDLNFRLHQKLTAVAEKSLDTTLAVLEKKGEAIPLPVLTALNDSIFEKLGYGPSGSAPTLAVQINNTNSTEAPSPTQATPEGLAKAREYLRMLEGANASSGPSPGNASGSLSRDLDIGGGPVVEGESHRVEP